jgi:hypothetical protein
MQNHTRVLCSVCTAAAERSHEMTQPVQWTGTIGEQAVIIVIIMSASSMNLGASRHSPSTARHLSAAAPG